MQMLNYTSQYDIKEYFELLDCQCIILRIH